MRNNNREFIALWLINWIIIYTRDKAWNAPIDLYDRWFHIDLCSKPAGEILHFSFEPFAKKSLLSMQTVIKQKDK